MIRIVIADDHPLILDGLDRLFTADGFEVVGRCVNGEEALAVVDQVHPDVLVLDMNMPRMHGFAVMEALQSRSSPPKTVLLTASLDEDDVMEALRLGVRGVVLKEMAPRLLLECVRHVSEGGQWLERRSVGLAVDKMLRRDRNTREMEAVLTPRERGIVRMVAAGLRNKEIAAQCFLAEGTVRIHLHNIYQKLKVSSRVELSRVAQEKGLT